jgi:hypothetical protein
MMLLAASGGVGEPGCWPSVVVGELGGSPSPALKEFSEKLIAGNIYATTRKT